MNIVLSEESNVAIYNAVGQIVYNAEKVSGSLNVSLDIPAGIYFVKINGRTEKIVVR